MAEASIWLRHQQQGTGRDHLGTPSDAVQSALYAMQLELDAILPINLSAVCRLIAAEYVWTEDHVRQEADEGQLLVMVADMTGARSLLGQKFALDAMCKVTVKEAGQSKVSATGVAMHYPEKQLATWGHVLAFTLPRNPPPDLKTGEVKKMSVVAECKQVRSFRFTVWPDVLG